jgi:hypothetical protein
MITLDSLKRNKQHYIYNQLLQCTAKILQYTENSKHIFPEKELHGHSPNSYIHVFVCDLFTPTIGRSILLQKNRWSAYGIIINRSHTHACGNWD